jgi:hypothetical protein
VRIVREFLSVVSGGRLCEKSISHSVRSGPFLAVEDEISGVYLLLGLRNGDVGGSGTCRNRQIEG